AARPGATASRPSSRRAGLRGLARRRRVGIVLGELLRRLGRARDAVDLRQRLQWLAGLDAELRKAPRARQDLPFQRAHSAVVGLDAAGEGPPHPGKMRAECRKAAMEFARQVAD